MTGHVFLIGYRGTGKTTVAGLLAKALERPWTDTDDQVEAEAATTIAALFASEGEAGFRRRESLALARTCALSPHVVATGGGIVLLPENRQLLRTRGFPIWLTAPPEVLWKRIQQDEARGAHRPNLTVGGLTEVRDVLARRLPLYQECARLTVDVGGRLPEDVVETILRQLPQS